MFGMTALRQKRPFPIDDAFWIREAEAQSLLLLMAFYQRLGDVFMARAGKGPRKACSYRVEEGTADAPKLAFAA